MKTTRHLVATLIELATSVQNGEYHLKSRLTLLFVPVCRDTATVILDRDRVVLVDCYIDVVTVACESLVDRVVYYLVHKMVKTLLADVANIHRWSLTYGLQAFEDLNIRRRILLLVFFDVLLFGTHISVIFTFFAINAQR